MHLPPWNELIEEQLDVLETPLDESLFVVGPPGSGKTVLAVQRTDMLHERHGPAARLVTFNRMLRRLASLLSSHGSPATMHSFASLEFQKQTGEKPPTLANSYDFDWATMITKAAGTNHLYEHIVIDEGQDLPQDFYSYVTMCLTKHVSVFADEDQAISGRRTTLEQIQNATGLRSPRILTCNHRNAPEIARVAEHFHSGRLPAASVQRGAISEVPQLICAPDLKTTANRIAIHYRNRGGTIGVVVCRNATILLLLSELQKKLSDVRISFYMSGSQNDESINLLDPGITLLNKESVKGQEFDALFVTELEQFIPCSSNEMKRAMYMLCTRARDFLFLVYGPAPLSIEALASLPEPSLLRRT